MGASASNLWPLLVLLVFTASCSAPRATWIRQDQPPKPSPAQRKSEAPASAERHVVAAGENLYRISLRYGVDVDELASLNGISDPASLSVGTALQLPPRRRAPSGRERSAAPGVRSTSLESRPPSDRQGLLVWPVKGVLYSRFGQRGASRHDGIDIAAPEGSPIVAAADGEVIFAGTQRGYGNLVILRHDGGLVTIYAHNRENVVKEGDRVRQGELIGRVGRTGRATGPHCHFEVRQGTTPLEPLDFLPP